MAREGSWPTPRAIDGRGAGPGTSDDTLVRRAQTSSGDSRNLPEMVQSRERGLSRHWPTPRASLSEQRTYAPLPSHHAKSHGRQLQTEVNAAEGRVSYPHPQLWPMPLGTDAKGGRRSSHGRPDGLQSEISRRQWPTPNANEDGYRLAGDTQQSKGLGAIARHEAIAHGSATGQLNPEWVEWLMGYPIGWTDLTIGRADLVDVDWTSDPADDGSVPRVASGVKRRRERLMALGNAVVPEIPERLGRYLLTLLED